MAVIWDDTLERRTSRLEQLTRDLRTGRVDHRIIAYKSLIGPRRSGGFAQTDGLLIHLHEHDYDVELDNDQGSRRLRTPPRGERPNRKIVEVLSESGLEEQVFTYLSRFAESPRGELARVGELLQVSIFLRALDDRRAWQLKHGMNHFRSTQKIRNEYGLMRSNSSSKCFQSFEDIVKLERSICEGDGSSLVVQCWELGVTSWPHLERMFECASTFAQLTTVFNVLNPFFGRIHHLGYAFARRFDALAERGSRPEWPAVNIYLIAADIIREGYARVIREYVSDGDLNKVLNYLTNRTLRRLSLRKKTSRLVNCWCPHQLTLLNRGASLYHKNRDERWSSIGALVKIAKLGIRSTSLSEYFEFMCCPLLHQPEVNEVTFDPFQVMELSCLAARKIPSSVENSNIPCALQHYVMAHQELQSLLGGNVSSTSVDEESSKAVISSEESTSVYRAPFHDIRSPWVLQYEFI